jgi:hypothetical protein
MSQSQSPLDERSEAHDALSSAVANYGTRVLDNSQMLGNVVTDLLPDSPRERNLLIAAAEAGVAAELNQHVQEQHVDAGTAVQLVAHGLAERKSIDAAASMWVTTEYARALGYPVHPSVPPSTPEAPGYSIPPPRSAGGLEGTPASSWPGLAAPGSPAPGGPPGPGGLPAGPPPGGGRRKLSGGIIAIGAAALVLVAYLGIAAGAKVFPFAASHPVATPSSSPAKPIQPTSTPTPTAQPTPSLAPGVANLTQLLPGDLDQPAIECPALTPPYPWKMPGLVEAVQCTDPNLPGGTILAFQTDNSADYQASWQNFLNWWGFDLGSAQPGCPPATLNGEGTIGWHDQYFPDTPNQSLICGWVGSNLDKPAYAWAYPTEDAFIYAVGAKGSTFSDLNYWWEHNATESASPTPASP